MTDHKEIYQSHAENYDPLIMHEDYEGNLLKALQEITTWEGTDVVDAGAGTGRFTCMLSPLVRSIQAFDREDAMLEVAREKLQEMGTTNWQLKTADHRSLPVADHSVDVVISGWSVCYLVAWDEGDWRVEVTKAIREMKRILRPGGWIILVETQGTGFTEPTPPAHLLDYFQFLDEQGFAKRWIRTDYLFESVEQAKALSGFFFGEEMADQIQASNSRVLPECTGIWWMQVA